MATTVRLSQLAQNALMTLKHEVLQQEGHRASRDDLASALVWGATPAQAAGMLIAYNRAIGQAESDEPAA